MHDPATANWIGLWTLYVREVRRFAKVYMQTLLAPMVTTLLFFAVFALALGEVAPTVAKISFLNFLAPGLIIMAIAQNSFANTSSSLMSLKIQGNIVDTLMPPLTASELHFGFSMGGVTRGSAVGFTLALVMSLFVDLGVHSFGHIMFHGIMTSMMLSQLGVLGAIWAEKWDHISGVTNFVITPLAFLSGTFYSIQRLPEIAQTVAHFNPFFYMIDGFRYGFIGYADGNITVGLLVMAAINISLWTICTRLFASGYKLKP